MNVEDELLINGFKAETGEGSSTSRLPNNRSSIDLDCCKDGMSLLGGLPSMAPTERKTVDFRFSSRRRSLSFMTPAMAVAKGMLVAST